MFFQLKLSPGRKKSNRQERRSERYLSWHSTCECCRGYKLWGCESIQKLSLISKCFVFNFWLLSSGFRLHILASFVAFSVLVFREASACGMRGKSESYFTYRRLFPLISDWEKRLFIEDPWTVAIAAKLLINHSTAPIIIVKIKSSCSIRFYLKAT